MPRPPRQPTVVVDGLPLDTGYRTRGVGRYTQGLLGGLALLRNRGDLDDLDVRVLRAPDADDGDFERVTFRRLFTNNASEMHFENLARLDRVMPAETAAFHATALDGVTRKTPLISTCHDLIPLLLADQYLVGRRPGMVLERIFWHDYLRVLRRVATRVVAISNHVRGTLVDTFGVDPAKIDVVEHGVDEFWAEDAGAPSDRLAPIEALDYVLFVGGFDPRKNFDGFLGAIAALDPDSRPTVVVAGERHARILEKHARLLGELPAIDVRFIEYVSDADLRWLYSHARLLAFTSVEEGWGFPILEAMAAGTPVVCARWGSMAEAAGDAGCKVDVRDVDALRAAFEQLLTDESLCASLSEAGRRRAGEFTWESTAASVADVYRDVVL